MMTRFRILFLSISLGISAPATWSDEAPRLTAYHDGDFEGAYSIAEAEEPSADTLAFMARAILADCIVIGTDPPDEQLKRAESLAARALQLDDAHIEAKLQLAISLSLQARNMSVNEARKSGYGELSRLLANEVLDADPDNAWAHGFLSVWNVEVRRVGGMIGASIMGASLDKAETHFKAAAASDPANLTVKWQYARALTALNTNRYEEDILSVLQDIAGREPGDAIERSLQIRAIALVEMIEDGRLSDAENAARGWL